MMICFHKHIFQGSEYEAILLKQQASYGRYHCYSLTHEKVRNKCFAGLTWNRSTIFLYHQMQCFLPRVTPGQRNVSQATT